MPIASAKLRIRLMVAQYTAAAPTDTGVRVSARAVGPLPSVPCRLSPPAQHGAIVGRHSARERPDRYVTSLLDEYVAAGGNGRESAIRDNAAWGCRFVCRSVHFAIGVRSQQYAYPIPPSPDGCREEAANAQQILHIATFAVRDRALLIDNAATPPEANVSRPARYTAHTSPNIALMTPASSAPAG